MNSFSADIRRYVQAILFVSQYFLRSVKKRNRKSIPNSFKMPFTGRTGDQGTGLYMRAGIVQQVVTGRKQEIGEVVWFAEV